jgi:E-phenylitaconyl-CoA hydratase
MATVEYMKKDKIAYITINRPDSMNSLNREAKKELEESYLKVKNDNDVWVAIITGTGGKAFSAGSDIKEPKPVGTKDKKQDNHEPLRPDMVWKPFIAAIHGYCLGGGLELALECDIRIAAKDAQFGLPEVNIGSIAFYGGAVRLPRLISGAIAAEMLLTGMRIDAKEAYRIGLVSRIVPTSTLLNSANEIAKMIVSRGPLSVQKTKELMVRSQSLSLQDGILLNTAFARYISTTEDFIEGAQAFAQKRPPLFKAK